MLRGSLDEMVGNFVGGWALNTDEPDEHLVIVVSDEANNEVARGLADTHRSDLEAAGLGRGDHAFRVALPIGTNLIGLIISARSNRHGQLELLTKRERVLADTLRRYEKAVADLSKKVDGLQSQFETIRRAVPADDTEHQKTALESIAGRVAAAEVFIIRIDEMMRKLMQDGVKRRKRFFGLF